MGDFHIGSIVLVGVEAFDEDKDGCGYFFWHQSMTHTFFSHLGSLMQEHPKEFCMLEGFWWGCVDLFGSWVIIFDVFK